MSLRALAVTALLLVAGSTGAADEKKKAAGDQTQSLDSPLPLVGGATLTASKDDRSVSLAINRQLVPRGLFWQVGVTGSATEGDAPVFSRSTGISSGFSAKIGLGYSSFLAEKDEDRLKQLDSFLAEAWCLDVMAGAAKVIGEAFIKLPTLTRVSQCQGPYELLTAAVPPWKSNAGDEAAKPVETVLGEVDKVIKAAYDRKTRTTACKALDKIDWAKKACSNPNDEELQAETYPALYDRVMTIKQRPWRIKLSANWTPSVTGAKYRPVTDGAPDLADEKKWTGFLNGGTLDATFHYRTLIAGLQFGYADKLDDDAVKQVDVCKRTTQGDFYSDDCKKAVIGKPQPFANPSVGTVLALDPLIPSLGQSSFRPGAQLAAKWERLAEGKRRYTVSLPLYLARVDAPLDFVFGIKPSYEWDRGGKRSEDFVVSVFIGARP